MVLRSRSGEVWIVGDSGTPSKPTKKGSTEVLPLVSSDGLADQFAPNLTFTPVNSAVSPFLEPSGALLL
jgi:hypothetical protein